MGQKSSRQQGYPPPSEISRPPAKSLRNRLRRVNHSEHGQQSMASQGKPPRRVARTQTSEDHTMLETSASLQENWSDTARSRKDTMSPIPQLKTLLDSTANQDHRLADASLLGANTCREKVRVADAILFGGLIAPCPSETPVGRSHSLHSHAASGPSTSAYRPEKDKNQGSETDLQIFLQPEIESWSADISESLRCLERELDESLGLLPPIKSSSQDKGKGKAIHYCDQGSITRPLPFDSKKAPERQGTPCSYTRIRYSHPLVNSHQGLTGATVSDIPIKLPERPRTPYAYTRVFPDGPLVDSLQVEDRAGSSRTSLGLPAKRAIPYGTQDIRARRRGLHNLTHGGSAVGFQKNGSSATEMNAHIVATFPSSISANLSRGKSKTDPKVTDEIRSPGESAMMYSKLADPARANPGTKGAPPSLRTANFDASIASSSEMKTPILSAKQVNESVMLPFKYWSRNCENDEWPTIDAKATGTEKQNIMATHNEDLEFARLLAAQSDLEIRREKQAKLASSSTFRKLLFYEKSASQKWYEHRRDRHHSRDHYDEAFPSMPGSYPPDWEDPVSDATKAWLTETRQGQPMSFDHTLQEASDLALARALAAEEEEAYAQVSSRPRTKDCIVCTTTLPTLSFPAKAPSPQCTHLANICTPCLQDWITSQLDSTSWSSIRCPECPTLLCYADIQTSASAETFSRYDSLCVRSTLGTIPTFSWCLRPQCGSGQENLENAEGAFMECMKCKYRQCLKHKCVWHDGESCKTYEYRVSGKKKRDEERKNEEYLNKEAKKCPGRNCGAYIQKTYGCDHMTCNRCRTQFCYICCALYVDIKKIGNEAHKRTCPYHSQNLTDANPYPH